jgi:hypothetical protein
VRDLVIRCQRERAFAGIDLDAGHDALANRQFRQCAALGAALL